MSEDSRESFEAGPNQPEQSKVAVPPVLATAAAPPPLPVAVAEASAITSIAETFTAGRLHPCTLLIALVRAVRGFAIPAIIILATGGGATFGLFLVFLLAMSLLVALVRYLTFSYRVQGDELITRQGLISRQERHIPLRRVQDLRLEAGLVHRLLNVVDVHVETAGGEGVEAALSVLARKDAEQLRQTIFSAAGRSDAVTGDRPEENEALCRLSMRDLVLEGLTSNRAASVLVLVGAAMGFADDLIPRAQWEAWMAKLGEGAESLLTEDGVNWLGISAAAAVVLVVSAVFSVVGSIVIFHGFALVRRGEDLFRSYGLFTRRASSLPRRRIQVVQVEEPLLRRWLGLAVVRADSAAKRAGGDKEKRGGRDVLLPLVRRTELDRILPELAADIGPEPATWERVAPCAVRRATKKAAIISLFMALAILLGPLAQMEAMARWHALWALGLIPLTYWISRRSYAHLGFADSGDVFRTRRGWVDRTTHIVPVRNLQVVILKQNPFDRRYGVWTMKLDTAGQAYTGGGPALRNVSAAAAWEVARSLARRAARMRYRL